MAATVTAKLALDSSGFTAGLTRAQAALGKLGAIGVPVMAAGFAAAAAAAAGLAVGIKKAVDIGGALSELSARTGVAAGELRVLQMAFQRAGLSAEQVGPAINKMQRAIIEAGQGSKTAQNALANLGLSVEQLSGMSPDKQFEAIGQAIGALQNPAAQAAAAMQIFGRSGGEMLALFKDSGALGDAARAIGSQADLLTRNANLFDRASDILNTIGSKLEGFFVGVADQVVPAILPLLEAADGLDFAGLGQELGRQIAIGITALQDGSIGNIIGLSAQIALRRAANDFLKTMQGLAAGFPALFEGTIKNFALIASPEFWSGVKSAFLSAAITFGQKLSYLVADALAGLSEITGLRDMIAPALSAAISAGDSYAGQANELNASADAQLGSVASAITANMQEAYARFSDAFLNGVQNATETFDNGDLANALNEAIAAVSATVDKNTADARARFEASKTQIPAMDEEFGKAAKEASGVITDSLQQVGGGGNFARFGNGASPELNESKKQTGLLGRIAEGIGAAVTASDRAITSVANAAFNGGNQITRTPSPLAQTADAFNAPAPVVNVPPVNVPPISAPAVNVPSVNVPAPAVNIPAVNIPAMQMPQMPALRDQRVSAFPDFGGTSDIAAQHLRESQKQTGLLQKIFDSFSKIAPQLMPA